MPYLQGGLLAGERVVYRAKPHGVALLGPCAAGLAAAALLLAAAADPALRLLGAAGIGLLLAAAPAALRHLTTEYVVTNRRLCVRAGILSVVTRETVLSKVGSIAVEQGPAGRALGFGTLIVRCDGGAAESLRGIPAPDRLRRSVHEALAGAAR